MPAPRLDPRFQKAPPHVLFAGGATGGHLFPGLAAADQLQREVPTVRITFCGVGTAFERQQVHRAGFEFKAFPCRPLPRRARDAWRFVLQHHRGVQCAGQFILEQRVSLAVGLGSYASLPAARAASKLGVPLVLMEQNVLPGRANRWLAGKAEMLFVGWQETREYFASRSQVFLTGNPVRPQFIASVAQARNSNHNRLVVLGGSGGAGELNEQVPRALYKARHLMRDWEIVHQCGPRAAAQTQELYGKFAIKARVEPFLDAPADLLSKSDLVISRAGGSTLAELAILGVPAVLMPYPEATDNHQRRNAEVLATAGAAVIVDSREVKARVDDRLAGVLAKLLPNTQMRSQMADSMLQFGRPDAARRVVEGLQLLLPTPAAALRAA